MMICVMVLLLSIMLFDCVCCFFFFKQKTAYEMRISDLSSDVCSSDLSASGRYRRARCRAASDCQGPGGGRVRGEGCRQCGRLGADCRWCGGGQCPGHRAGQGRWCRCGSRGKGVSGAVALRARSEEHTSELQSLMRISYAVFCLKQKTIIP